MPTQKPRITVTLDEPVYETISRMALLTNQSKGSIIAELLDSVHPPLMRTVALLEAASEAPLQIRQGLASTIESLERQAQAAADLTVDQMDWLQGALRMPPAEREASEGTPPTSPKRPADPRPSNTGVRSPRKRKKGK